VAAASPALDKAERVQRKVRSETAGWVEPVGRLGLASQGVLYAIVGVLALQVAKGSDDRADQRGAIEAVAHEPFGRVLLVVLLAGLALHATWRFLLAARGDVGERDAKAWVKRVGHFGRGLLYAGFTIAAIEVLLDSEPSGAGDQQRHAAATVLDWPGGTVLVVLAGLAVIGGGLWHLRQPFTRSFEKDLALAGRPQGTRTLVVLLGSVGYAARGFVFAAVGWFLLQAALDHDPNQSGGLDNALKRLAASEHGAGVLRLVATGVFLFGVFRIADAMIRKPDAISNA
jgi:hypothetical protein